MKTINNINQLPIKRKNELCAIWMSKARIDKSKSLNLMLDLDNIWDKVYEENRIKLGFYNAALKANEKVLSIIYK